METLSGYVEHIVFQNSENGYTVLNFVSGDEEITCVGIFHGVSEGETLELTGEYTTHPSYGRQFKMQSFGVKSPEDILSIERYLGSGAIKGIGVALASRIVRRFKEGTCLQPVAPPCTGTHRHKHMHTPHERNICLGLERWLSS